MADTPNLTPHMAEPDYRDSAEMAKWRQSVGSDLYKQSRRANDFEQMHDVLTGAAGASRINKAEIESFSNYGR